MVEKWLSEDPEGSYVLGKDAPYSKADAMMTVFLVRLKTSKEFFQKEVMGRKCIGEYYLRMELRESFKEANIVPVEPISIFDVQWYVVAL